MQRFPQVYLISLYVILLAFVSYRILTSRIVLATRW